MPNQLGKYRLVRLLGSGGMGEVWESLDTVLDRRVAIKLLFGDDAAAIVHEASAAAKVSHPHIVTLYDAAEADGRWFLVMEFITGHNVGQHITNNGRLTWQEAVRIARDAAAGLSAIHAAGLIHRDVKPANILLTADGIAKITDFGLARPSARTGLTVANRVVGTPHYMSPEQCWCEPTDVRTDVYSLGATLYSMLTGRTPFDGGNEMGVMYAHCHAPIPDPRATVPDLPSACTMLIQRSMAKQPAERFPTVEAFRLALESLLTGSATTPISSLPPTIDLPLPSSSPGPFLQSTSIESPLPAPPARSSRRAWLAGVPVLAAALGAIVYAWPRRKVDSSSASASDPVPGPTIASPDRPTKPWPLGQSVLGITISPDNEQIGIAYIPANLDREGVDVRSWSGASRAGWPKSGLGAESVAFSADGRQFAAAFRGSERVQVWDLRTDQPIGIENADHIPGASAVVFSDDHQWLVVGIRHPTGTKVRIWQWQGDSWAYRHEYVARESILWAFSLEPKSHRLAFIAADGDDATARSSFHLLDIRTGKPLIGPKLNLKHRWVGPTVVFAPQGNRFAFSAGGNIQLFDTTDWSALPIAFPPTTSEIWSLVFSHDAELLFAAEDALIQVFHTRTGKHLGRFGPFNNRVFAMVCSLDGRTLLSGGEEGLVRFHDLTTFAR